MDFPLVGSIRLAAAATGTLNTDFSTAPPVLSWSGPTSGDVGVAVAFTATLSGPVGTVVRVTPSVTGGGTTVPAFRDIAAGSVAGSFTYTPPSAGSKSISVANDKGFTQTGTPITFVAAAPAAVPTYTNVLPTILWDTGSGGPTRSSWGSSLTQSWTNYMGDWSDNSTPPVPNGSVPHGTVNVTALAEFSINVTAIVQTGKPIFLRAPGSVRLAGRLSATPPRIVATNAVGDPVTVTVVALSKWDTSSAFDYDSTVNCTVADTGNGALTYSVGVGGPVTSATLYFTVTAKSSGTQLLNAFVCEALPCYIGGGGRAPVLGLAAEVGETGMDGHADVYLACDFSDTSRFSSWAPEPGVPMEFLDDPDAPGRKIARGKFVPTGNSSLVASLQLSTPNLADPRRPILFAPQEVYQRMYLLMESDWIGVYQDGQKSGFGWDQRFGYWAAGGYWQATAGNDKIPGTGLKTLMNPGTPQEQWLYEGHSQRLEFFQSPTDLTHPYRGYRPIQSYLYHLDQPQYNGELFPMGNVCAEIGKWVCIEQYIKTNSIIGPYDANGNGTAVADGIMRTWVDGVPAKEYTNLRWRRHPDMGIEGPWINWYYGGTSLPPHEMHYQMRDFACAKRYIGPKQAAALNVWTEIPNTAVNNAVVSSNPGPSIGSRWAWCGVSMDTRTDTIWSIANGGHTDYAGNEALKITMSDPVPRWIEVTPSDPNPGTASVDWTYYPSNGGQPPKPAATHSYYANQFIERRNRAMRFGSGSAYRLGNPTPNVDGFNCNAAVGSNGYDPQGTYLNSPHGAGYGWGFCKDPTTEDVYGIPYNPGPLRKWTEATGVWSSIGPGTNRQFKEGPCAFDTVRRRIFALYKSSYAAPRTIDVATGVFTTQTLTGSGAAACTAGNREGMGMVYVPAMDAFIVKVKDAGGIVYKIDAATLECTELITTGGTTMPVSTSGADERIYTRVQYSPTRKGIYYAPNTSANIWFLRLHQ